MLGSSSLAAGAQPLARNSGTLVAAGCTGRRAETVGRHREGRLSVQGARRPPKYPGKARVGYLTPRRLRAEPPSCQWNLGHRGALLPPLIIVPASYRRTYALDHPTQTPWPLAPPSSPSHQQSPSPRLSSIFLFILLLTDHRHPHRSLPQPQKHTPSQLPLPRPFLLNFRSLRRTHPLTMTPL